MRHIGLFEGIGGFSLAARSMGWETIAWCEWNEFLQTVLKYHFPNAKPHGETLKGAGNAIVPKMALQIFKAIEKLNSP